MTNRGALVVALVVGGCAPPPSSTPADAGHVVESARPGAHSHNDEDRAAPLDEALALRFASIEVDVLVWEGELVAAHDLFNIRGGLAALYLDPLAERIASRGGSVYGDGASFDLWIDLKSGDAIVRDAVHDALAGRDWITRWDDDVVDARAVRVIFTGDEASKAAYVDEHALRYACRDSNVLRLDDPTGEGDARFCAYALDFRTHVDDAWSGDDDAPAPVVDALADVVAQAADKQRPLRLWGAPDTPASWRAQRAAGVDWIGADDLAGLAATYE